MQIYSNNDDVFFNLLMKPLRWSDIVCEMIIRLFVNILLNGKFKNYISCMKSLLQRAYFIKVSFLIYLLIY